MYINIQVATALLVAGSTPTFWIPQFVSTSLYSSVVQALGCSHNCRRLTYGSFQLTHMSRDTTQFNWSSRGGQNEDRTLSQRSQRCHNGEFRHVSISTTVITTMWTESSWAFPESYSADESWIVRSSDGGQQWDKRAHNSTSKVSFCTITIRLCHCLIAITRV